MRPYLGFGLTLFGLLFLWVDLFSGAASSTPENNQFMKGLVISGIFVVGGIGIVWGWLHDREGRRKSDR